MFTKANVAATAAVMSALVIPAVASAHSRNELRALYALAHSATHGRGAPNVTAPDGRYLGTDPDLAIRSELGRDWASSRVS